MKNRVCAYSCTLYAELNDAILIVISVILVASWKRFSSRTFLCARLRRGSIDGRGAYALDVVNKAEERNHTRYEMRSLITNPRI